MEMTQTAYAGWINWKHVLGMLCDRRKTVQFKGNVYKIVVSRAPAYRADMCGGESA